jgi:acetyltransferase-like isoleucine patch superfamily enzyme
MAFDQWLVRKLVRIFLRRYAPYVREELHWLGQESEHGYFDLIRAQLGACGELVSFRAGTRVFYPATVRLGSYITFNYGCLIMGQGGVEIADFCVLGPHTIIATVSHPVDGIYYGTACTDSVKLGENVWIGSGAIVLPGVEIGDNSIIGAGAVVTESIPANKIALGIPARVTSDVPVDLQKRREQADGLRTGQRVPTILSHESGA